MRPVYRGNPPPTVTALAAGRMRQAVAYNYHAVGAALLTGLGEYCSYCESPLGGSAAVEHIVSKSAAPALENRWDNFLLACVNCNSTKGSAKVDRLTDLPRFIWPCTPRDVANAQGQIVYYSPVGAFDYYIDAEGNALVRPADGAGDKRDRAVRTLELVGLDKPPNPDPAVKDRRIANRTATWNVATQLASALAPCLNDDGTVANEAGALLQEQIIEVAKMRGFWSVWMTVFTATLRSDRHAAMADGVRSDLLYRLFCASMPGTYYGDARHGLPPLPADYTGLPTEA